MQVLGQPQHGRCQTPTAGAHFPDVALWSRKQAKLGSFPVCPARELTIGVLEAPKALKGDQVGATFLLGYWSILVSLPLMLF